VVTVAECARVPADVPRAPTVSVGRRRRRRFRRRWVAHALSAPAAVVEPDARLALLAIAVGVRRALSGRAGPRRGRRGREMIRMPVCVVVGDSDRRQRR